MVRRSQASGGVISRSFIPIVACLLHRKEFPAFQRMGGNATLARQW